MRSLPMELQEGYDKIADGGVGFRCYDGLEEDDFEDVTTKIEVRCGDADYLAVLFGMISPHFDWYEVITDCVETADKLRRIRDIVNE